MQEIPKNKREFETKGHANWIDASKALRMYEDSDGQKIGIYKSHMVLSLEAKYEKMREESALLVLTKSKHTYQRLKPIKWLCVIMGFIGSFVAAKYVVPFLFMDAKNDISKTTSKFSEEFGFDYA